MVAVISGRSCFTESSHLVLLLLLYQGLPTEGNFLRHHQYHIPDQEDGTTGSGSFFVKNLRNNLYYQSMAPVFDPSPPKNVTAIKDDDAYLNCIIYNIGNKTVSWIREADLHILTVGRYTYTADNRFEVIHSSASNPLSWILKIKSVQPRDSGRYDCQVNTHQTDPITYSVYLSVFVPTAHIIGAPERFFDKGSTINLTCVINHNPESSTEIFWYHNNKVINYDNRDSRVSVITDRGAVTKTFLLIHDAHDGASGTYSCIPSHAAIDSIKIHILNGDQPAAMQTNSSNKSSGADLLLFIVHVIIKSTIIFLG